MIVVLCLERIERLERLIQENKDGNKDTKQAESSD